MKPKVLITGANGFVGSHVAAFLLSKNISMNLMYGPGSENLQTKGSYVDLLDLEALKKVISRYKPSIIVHLGAHVDLSNSYDIISSCVQNNIQGTLNLLEASRKTSVSKFVFASTMEIYGSNKPPYSEKMTIDPPSGYSISKSAGEYYCKLYSKLYGINYIILRLSNIYGPGQNKQRLIPSTILKALNNENITIGTGSNKRDFIYIDDICSVILKIIKHKKVYNEIFNIGSNKSYSVEEIVKKILKLTHSGSKFEKNKDFVRKHEMPEMRLSILHAQKCLDWRPKVDILGGLKKTIDYYSN